MAPWPEQGHEPKAPDKLSKARDAVSCDYPKVNLMPSDNVELIDKATKGDDKPEGSRRKFVDEEEKVSPEENCGVSTLDDGQLKALLDEAITYKCPKDREGKSDLFRELLQEAEADETKKSDCQQKHHVIKSGEIGGARASTGGRRRKRDGAYITERQTKGGSLQNIPQEVNAEFDHESSFSYCLRGASGSGTRRKKRNSGSFRDSGVSVSARQREGGSLPSNVDGGSGGMLTLSHLDLPSTSASLRFEEVRHPKLTIPCMRRDGPGYTYIGTNDAATSMTPVRDGESYSGSATSDFMVIEVGNLGLVDHENALDETASGGNGISRHRKFSGDLSNMKPGDEGIEMEVLNRDDCTSSSNIKYTSHATLEVGPERRRDHTDLTNVVTFPLSSCEKHLVNGVEQVSLQFPTTYNSVKCIMSANTTTTTTTPTTTTNTTSNIGGSGNTIISRESSKGGELIRKCCSDTNKPTMVYTGVPVTHHMSVLSIPPNSLIATSLRTEGVSRLTLHGNKDSTGDAKVFPNLHNYCGRPLQFTRMRYYPDKSLLLNNSECKNVDENGNAVNQSYRTEAVPNNERKEKKRRTKTNTDRNVIMSQNIEGHRGDKDIDSLIKFIESDGEGKSKQKTNYHTNGSINFNTRHRNNVKKEDSNTVPKAKREEEEKVTRSRIQSGKKERCTDKGSQLKKSNSLEEISKSKLEDLMVNDDSVKKPLSTVSVSLEFEHHKNHALPSEDEENENVKLFVNENEDNNLWWSKQENSSGKEFVDQNSNLALVGKKRREEKKKRENLPPRNEEILSTASIPLEEPDFYVVKKKQRKKKRRSSTGGQGRDSLFDEDTNMGRFTSTTNQYGTKDYQTRRGLVSNSSVFPPHDHTLNRNDGSMILYQYRHLRQRSPDHRRKSTSSMPPSDKSESSDLDSVHSLPVSSTTPKPALDQTSTSSGSTPQASYADIARMASVNIVPMNCSGRWPVVSSTKSTIPLSSTFTSAITSANLAQIPKINTGIPLGSSSKSNMAISQCSITPEESHVTSNVNHDSELLHNPSVDVCLKKDAMTNTTSDYTLIPPCSVEEKPFSNTNSSNITDNLPGNLLLDDYYPSLEESLSVDKCERKAVKVNHISYLNLNISNVQMCKSSKNSLKPSEQNPNPQEMLNAFESVLVSSKTINSVSKSKSYLTRKNVTHRPPVILMDEKRREQPRTVPIVAASELIFGFEINEQLLSGSCEEESDESCVNITEVESQEVVTANLPETLSPSVINFINYFRQPSTMFPQQDELVNFIGRGWLDVMAEIVHSNGKVIYYNGH